ncbi:hypothetical protein AAG570_009178 [Ranatra chinensis]|uniref:Uncharacterized protein n=1 Tax=Ranatra chinensis TaxID=642074 RepID=A0ABD0ZE83_9HEMI
MPVPTPRRNATQVKIRFPCGVVAKGGRYGSIVELDVRWPAASVSLLPSQVQTYPEEVVTASLAFRTTFCQPAIGSVEPETWLDLLYCGHSPVGCTRPNATHKQLLYSEQIRGYPQLRNINLRCDLFGLAGHYALALRPSMQDPGEPIAATLDQHSLKVHYT